MTLVIRMHLYQTLYPLKGLIYTLEAILLVHIGKPFLALAVQCLSVIEQFVLVCLTTFYKSKSC